MICPCEDATLWESVKKRALTIPNLEFIERVPYHQIQEYYDTAQIFVNTSTYEGFPNSFIQAGLAGTALLSLRVDPDGMIGLFHSGILAGDDMKALIQGAHAMLSRPELLDEAQRGNARMIAEWLDNERNTNIFLEGLT